MGDAGFQRGRVRLVWSAGHELHGLEVFLRRRPFGDVLNEWLDEGDRTPYAELTSYEQALRSKANAEQLGALLVSWNLEDDDGNPVAPSAANLLRYCDSVMINQMQEGYAAALNRVPPPLPESSGDGPDEWDLGSVQEVATTTDG